MSGQQAASSLSPLLTRPCKCHSLTVVWQGVCCLSQSPRLWGAEALPGLWQDLETTSPLCGSRPGPLGQPLGCLCLDPIPEPEPRPGHGAGRSCACRACTPALPTAIAWQPHPHPQVVVELSAKWKPGCHFRGDPGSAVRH